MALKRVQGSLSATRCRCGPGRMPYTDAEGPRCAKCGNPLEIQLSRLTRQWLREAVDAELARRSASQ